MIQKIVLFMFVLLFCACAPEPIKEEPPRNAKDISRVMLYNDLANLKEGIWRVEEWKKEAKKICEDSKGIDCSILAEIYHDYFYGYGSKSDIQKSMDMLGKSCDSKDSLSCLRLAIYISQDSKDFTKSNPLFEKAYNLSYEGCSKDLAFDCYVLSMMYFEGYTPLQRDRQKAMQYANVACDMKLANSCIFLSINAEDNEQFQNARKKSCDLGVKEYCK